MIYASNGLSEFFIDLILLFFHRFFARWNRNTGFLTENNLRVPARLFTCFYVSFP